MTDEGQDVPIGQKRRSNSYGLVGIESRGGRVRRRGIGLEYRLSNRVRAPAGRHVDRLADQDWCRVLSPQSRNPTVFLVQQPGTVARYTNPSQVRI